MNDKGATKMDFDTCRPDIFNARDMRQTCCSFTIIYEVHMVTILILALKYDELTRCLLQCYHTSFFCVR